MAAFDPSLYLGQESNEIAGQFLTLKKDDLKALVKHLNLDVKAAMKKAVIQKAILNHLTSENVLEERYVDRGLPLQTRIELICYAYALRKELQLPSKSRSNSSKGSDNSSSSYQSNDSSVEKQTSVSPSVDSGQNSSSKSSSSSPQSFVSSSVTCNYCKGQGHVVSECLKLQRKHGQQSYESQPKGFVGHVVSVIQSAPIRVPTVSDDSVSAVEVIEKPLSVDGVAMRNLEPFVSDGFVSLSSDFVDATPIRILRDTGASHSLLLVDVLPFSSSSYSGKNVLIMGVDSDDFVSVPLHNVHLLSRLVSGPVTVGVRSSLPHKGIQFILGNDLAGEKVIADPYLPTRSCVDQPVDSVDPIEQKSPGHYSACAVTHAGDRKKEEKEKKTLKNTHAISKKTCDVSNDEIDLSETFVGQEMSDSILPSNSQDTRHILIRFE